MTSIILPCGCEITETTVLAMCGRHAQALYCKKVEHESRYREYVNALSLACAEASSAVRRGAERG